MKYSLGLMLALCLAGLQLIAVTIVVYSSYVTSERVLLDHAKALLSDVGANTTAHSKSFLAPALGAAELAARLAENEVVSSQDRQRLEQLLFQQLQTAPQFAGVFYGDEQGNFVFVNRSDEIAPYRSKLISHDLGLRQTELIWRGAEFEAVERRLDPADVYDPRTRPWYETAKNRFDSIWTDPYIFFTSQRPGITIAAPVTGDDGLIQGVIGVDIEISAISDFLSSLKIGDNGVALIVNRNGDVIAHPRPELLKAENDDGTFRFVSIDEISDPIARNLFGPAFRDGSLSVTEEAYTELTFEGETYISLIMPDISAALPWTIAIYAPERDFVGAIKENRYLNVWLAVVVAAVTGVVGLILANLIHRPVRAFADRSALISQGEMSPTSSLPKTYSELEHANEAMLHEIKQRQASEREYGLTFDMASRGMAQLDPNTGAFIRVNAKFAEMLGYEVEELLNLRPADLTHPDDPTISWDISDKSIEDHAINLEKRCIRKDGQAIWMKINAIMIRDSDGNPLHAVATVDEITSARAAEQQIQKLNRDMAHLARGELLGQMAAGLAHELNQPLTAIAQNVDAALITLSDPASSEDELPQILEDLEQQAHRAGDIIKALRGFARKGETWKAPFDINELLYQSQRLVQAEATEHGVDIRIDAADLPEVSGIRVQVAQVLVNLLRNAIEAIAGSGDNQKIVRMTGSVVADEVAICIEDTGAGVDSGIDLFGQFETTKNDGMGLGLSICRSIIETGGGKLWHDDTYVTGARFCFTVPIASEDVVT